MNHELLGRLILKSKKFKFPKTLLDEKLIMYSTTNVADESLDNFELTEKAIDILNGKDYKPKEIPSEFYEEYYNRFTIERLGVSKVKWSPSQQIKKKLQGFMQKYKVSEEAILEAVDYYHKNCDNIRYSLDAQYFIEKDGASLLLDNIVEMNNPTNTQSFSKIV